MSIFLSVLTTMMFYGAAVLGAILERPSVQEMAAGLLIALGAVGFVSARAGGKMAVPPVRH